MHHRRCPGMIVPGHRAVRAPRPAAPRTQHEKDREMTEHPTEQPTPATDLRSWRREQLADLLRFGEASLRADGAAQWLDDDGRPDLSQPVHTWITSRMAHVYAFASLLGVPGAGSGPTPRCTGCGRCSSTPRTAAGSRRAAPRDAPVTATTRRRARPSRSTGRRARTRTRSWCSLPRRARSRAGRARASCSTRRSPCSTSGSGSPGRACTPTSGRATGPCSTRTAASTRTCTPSRRSSPRTTRRATPSGSRAASVADRVVGWGARTTGASPSTSTRTGTPAGLQRGPAPGPVQAVRVDAGPRPGVGAPAAPGRRRGRHARRAHRRRSCPVRPGRRGRLGRRARRRLRVHGRLVGHAGRAPALPLGRRGGRRGRRRAGPRHGRPRFAEAAAGWWAWIDEHLVDHERGSWHHELDTANRPDGVTWVGKPDVYHAAQAVILPDLPLTGSLAASAKAAGSILG